MDTLKKEYTPRSGRFIMHLFSLDIFNQVYQNKSIDNMSDFFRTDRMERKAELFAKNFHGGEKER